MLYGSVSAQIASKNLDSSESMAFGGPYGVRAYPGRAKRRPMRACWQRLELRYNLPWITPLGALQGQIFVDHGNVKLHQDPWPSYVTSGAPNSYQLKSAGLGANLYRVDSLLVSASVAHKIGSNPNPGVAGVDAGRARPRNALLAAGRQVLVAFDEQTARIGGVSFAIAMCVPIDRDKIIRCSGRAPVSSGARTGEPCRINSCGRYWGRASTSTNS